MSQESLPQVFAAYITFSVYKIPAKEHQVVDPLDGDEISVS